MAMAHGGLILLFLFGWGWGGNGGFGGGGNENVRDAVAYGFDINNLENGVRGLEHGICDGFYDMNTSLLTGFGNIAMGNMQNTNAITSQLSIWLHSSTVLLRDSAP